MVRNVLAVSLLAFSLTGCLSVKSYVDPALPKVQYSDLKPVDNKHPVQLFYEFKSKDSLNAAATKQTQPMVVDVLQKSALFSQVNTAPAATDYKLFVSIDNEPITKDAASKGVAVGLTFGMAGNMVTDGYICKVMYQAPGAQPIKKEYQHALHTTIGNADGPTGLQPYKPTDAIQKIIEELMLNTLNDLDKEGAL